MINYDMKDIAKGVLLVAVGLVAAIIVYPFTHELGHIIAAWISGVEIYEFNILPVPNVLCRYDSIRLESVAFVGFGGVLFPMLITGIRVPKSFLLWYFWFALKGVCVYSFLLSIWSLIFYQTGLEISGDDITQVLRFAPELRLLYIVAFFGLTILTLMQLIYSKPLQRCMKYFEV